MRLGHFDDAFPQPLVDRHRAKIAVIGALGQSDQPVIVLVVRRRGQDLVDVLDRVLLIGAGNVEDNAQLARERGAYSRTGYSLLSGKAAIRALKIASTCG